MSRFDGMDELLKDVQERAQRSSPADRMPQTHPPPSMPMPSEQYDTIVGNLNNLVHEARDLHQMVVAEDARLLTDGRREHLLMLLGQVLEELWNTEATLQGVR